MPRDPKDISVAAQQRTQRRIGELEDQKDPLRIRVGAGPAGPEGAEGPAGPEGAEGPEGKEGAAGRSNGLRYVFLTNTENTDPTSGRLKLNNATPGSATALRISETDADGNSLSAYVNSWDDSTSTSVRGQIIIRSIATKTDLLIYNVTGALTDNGTWDSLVVTSVVSVGTFSNNEEVTVEFIRTGDKGEKGEKGEKGAEGSISGIKRGTVTAVKAEEEKTVTHELGSEPAVVMLTVLKNGKFSNLEAYVLEKGATTFKFRNASLVEVSVMWLAVA